MVPVACQSAGLAVGKSVVYEGPAPVGKDQAGAAAARRRPGLGSSVACTSGKVEAFRVYEVRPAASRRHAARCRGE
jgi:hypothetical protein